MIYKLLILVLFYLLSVNAFSQKIGKKYFSYPDRVLEIQINDTCLLWRNTKVIGDMIEDYETFHYIRKGDTLFITENTFYGNQKQIIIQKVKYLDYMRYDKHEYLNDNCCGVLFKKNSLFFIFKYWYILEITKNKKRGTQQLTFDLYERLKRLKIFEKSCDTPLIISGKLW